MPFVPHTQEDIQAMLKIIGVDHIDALFNEIPDALRHVSLDEIPSGVSEMELSRQMRERAKLDGGMISFIGAGAYEHHIPAAVWEVASRGEFMTAYTPYQAEASQGSLQLIFEYQTMMASLMALDVSNASLYEGASALAEAVLMAARLGGHTQQSSVLMPESVHPYYRQTVETIVKQQHIELISVPYVAETGQIDLVKLKSLCRHDTVACIIPQPNFFGVLEDVDELTNWSCEQGILSIALVNPLAMSLLKPPGEWGEQGVDIACGDGQPLGVPLASGGPYYGFLCAKKKHIRQMPGRIVGKTVDKNGRKGFVLTLQAREQHIRRAKATSNICTNQGLMVTASTIHMSIMGPVGLRHTALLCHQRTRELRQAFASVKGVHVLFNAPFFHEFIIQIDHEADVVLHDLSKRGIQGGFALSSLYPLHQNAILVCATETKTIDDIQHFVSTLDDVLEKRRLSCPV